LRTFAFVNRLLDAVKPATRDGFFANMDPIHEYVENPAKENNNARDRRIGKRA
jgi:hypothetical protein